MSDAHSRHGGDVADVGTVGTDAEPCPVFLALLRESLMREAREVLPQPVHDLGEFS